MGNEKNNDQQIHAKDFLLGALVGGIVGSLTALLLAPKSGKELREDLLEQTKYVRDKTEYMKEIALQRGSEIANIAKEKTSQWTRAVQEQSQDFIQKVKTSAENMKKVENEYDDTQI